MSDRPFIVVIDDNPSVCKALGRLLRIARMDVETYTSGASFLLASLRCEPDCLVLDIRMPGMSGPELRDRLLGAQRRIPVVFITAHAEDENGLAVGATEVLRKPFDDQTLLDAVERVIRDGHGR